MGSISCLCLPADTETDRGGTSRDMLGLFFFLITFFLDHFSDGLQVTSGLWTTGWVTLLQRGAQEIP